MLRHCALCADRFAYHNLVCYTLDIAHSFHPGYLLLGFEFLGDALHRCHLLDQQFRSSVSSFVDLDEVDVQFAIEQQCGVICFLMLPEVSMAHSAVLAVLGCYLFWEFQIGVVHSVLS